MKIIYTLCCVISCIYYLYPMQQSIIDPLQKERIKNALCSENPTAIKNFLKQGLDPNTIIETQNKKPINLLHYAVNHYSWLSKIQNYKVIAALLKHGASIQNPDIQPLNILADQNNYYGILTLLCAGYSPNVCDITDYTPLISIARFGCPDDNWAGLKFLLAAGAGQTIKIECFKNINNITIAKTAYERAFLWNNPIGAALLKAEEIRWDEYRLQTNFIYDLFKHPLYNTTYKRKPDETRQQALGNALLPRWPRELVGMLIEFMRPSFNLGFTIPHEIVHSIQEELELQKLPIWVEKATAPEKK